MTDDPPREVRAAHARQAARACRETAEVLAATDPTGARFWRADADHKEREACDLMLPGGDVVTTASGEVALVTDVTRRDLVDRKPDSLDVGASRDRLNLLNNAEAVTLGLDMARSLGAADAGELALAHQMAAAHAVSMKLMEHANRVANNLSLLHSRPEQMDRAAMTAGRLVNAAGRLMGTYQDALATLHQKRRGGKQTVVVQHVSVNDGGQAVVTGNLDRGPEGRGDGG